MVCESLSILQRGRGVEYTIEVNDNVQSTFVRKRWDVTYFFTRTYVTSGCLVHLDKKYRGQ